MPSSARKEHSGSANNPADYSASAAGLTIPAGSLSRTMTPSFPTRRSSDLTEDAIVTMTAADLDVTVGSPDAFDLAITDNDAAPTISFTSSGTTVAEKIGRVHV